jgi:hypothetical protein
MKKNQNKNLFNIQVNQKMVTNLKRIKINLIIFHLVLLMKHMVYQCCQDNQVINYLSIIKIHNLLTTVVLVIFTVVIQAKILVK